MQTILAQLEIYLDKDEKLKYASKFNLYNNFSNFYNFTYNQNF